MDKFMFKHSGRFQLIDFQLSHNEMLLRSYANAERDYNIDILFKGVTSLNIKTTFYGEINIEVTTKKQSQLAEIIMPNEAFIFKIFDKYKIDNFIEAASFGAFKNKLDFGCTSLGEFMWSPSNECIYWSHDDEEFKRMFLL